MKHCDFIILANKEVREMKEWEDPTYYERTKLKKRVWLTLNIQEWNKMMKLDWEDREEFLSSLI